MKLDQAFINDVQGPILNVWSYIAADSLQCAADCGERMTNLGAIEGCIDADRLTSCAPNYARAAHTVADARVKEAFEQHGYDKTLRFLGKHIKLV